MGEGEETGRASAAPMSTKSTSTKKPETTATSPTTAAGRENCYCYCYSLLLLLFPPRGEVASGERECPGEEPRAAELLSCRGCGGGGGGGGRGRKRKEGRLSFFFFLMASTEEVLCSASPRLSRDSDQVQAKTKPTYIIALPRACEREPWLEAGCWRVRKDLREKTSEVDRRRIPVDSHTKKVETSVVRRLDFRWCRSPSPGPVEAR